MSHITRKRVLFASPWWHSAIVNGIVRHAADHGWHLDLQTCFTGRLPDHWQGDGMITQLETELDQLNRLIEQNGCPAVSLNRNSPEMHIPLVCTDSASAGSLAAEHLIERGFSNFAFYYSGILNQRTIQRFESFKSVLAEHGHKPIYITRTLRKIEQTRDEFIRHAWLREQVQALPKPIGIFAFNDQDAVAVIEACLSESINVPNEIAVLGMLDMEVFRHSTTIGLSSISFDFDAMTRRACDLLADMMDGAPAPEQAILFPPTGIAVRKSTDTLVARQPLVAKALRFMLDHYSEDIRIQDILQHVGGSRSGLFKAFASDLKSSPGEILNRIRVDKAKRLLRHTDAKIYAISNACGFGEPVNLYRIFKQHTDLSPNAYRKLRKHQP